ncbi:MAG: 2-C-methyl-D-erythritol 4-phosphate cytidylyltransferase, partial [Pseudomonadota bacterium]
MTTAAIIVAGGSGLRAGGERPKQYQQVGGRAVMAYTLAAFADHPQVDLVQPVIGDGHAALFAETCGGIECLAPVTGGVTRQASVMAGLTALSTHAPGRVLIHDAARPFVSERIISEILAALDSADGALPVLPVVDTIKRADGTKVVDTLDRTVLRAAQTPQGFRYGLICKAHEAAAAEAGHAFTDDASIGEWAGLTITMVDGAPENRKLTTQNDIEEARAWMTKAPSSPLT